MLHVLLLTLSLVLGPASPCLAQVLSPASVEAWQDFLNRAEEQHGQRGAQAARFLAEQRPEQDAWLSPELLLSNLSLALKAQDEFPWSKDLSVERFHNDVLPYAVFDETREDWRPAMYALARECVLLCKTASEAAQALNQNIFQLAEVHYNTGRKRANQSPSESMASGRASCTGLSILLVDACRSVGIPARAAGVAQWNGKPGNHTWVEIWDAGWHFTGADEYDPKGLDHAWFQGAARQALAGVQEHAVWATSWRSTGVTFPMVWDPDSSAIGAVDVTSRYAPEPVGASAVALRNLRVWSRRGGKRLALKLRLVDQEGRLVAALSTLAGTHDLNDMPQLSLLPKALYRLLLRRGALERSLELSAARAGEELLELYWDELPLGEVEAQALIDSLASEHAAELVFGGVEELEQKTISYADKSMRYLERSFGDEPKQGHSLWIAMHGGGGAPAELNDGQWRNQIRLYDLDEGIYVAPRAPSNAWDLWHQGHIDPLFGRLIDLFVAMRGVDPNRVYLLGYSAGGDGVYQLAPRMADRFAAACMMAGHPNEAQPLGLRNLPLGLFVGAQDAAYGRNSVAAGWNAKLDELHAADPEGYEHRFNSYPECGHWMDGQDAEGLPWMATKSRLLWPSCVVWYQDDVLHPTSYWLEAAPGAAAKGQLVSAEVQGQMIRLKSDSLRSLVLRLHDRLIDLDQEITVMLGGQVLFQGFVPRTEKVIRASVQQRCDPEWVASARLELEW